MNLRGSNFLQFSVVNPFCESFQQFLEIDKDRVPEVITVIFETENGTMLSDCKDGAASCLMTFAVAAAHVDAFISIWTNEIARKLVFVKIRQGCV